MAWTGRSGNINQDRTGQDRRKLATYLGELTSPRFKLKQRPPRNVAVHRFLLATAAVVLFALGFWGLWREFFG